MANDIPVKLVLEMKAKGIENDKIVTELKNKNYNYQQIRDALEQAAIKKTVLGSPSGTPPPAAPAPGVPPVPGTPAPPVASPPPKKGIDIDEIQRIIEEIIDEKWIESEARLKKLETWKTENSAKVGGFEKRLDDFSNSLSSMQGVLSEKAEEFSETMQNVDTEMKALEKALNRIVPSLSDNIKELRDIVKEMKE